MIQIIQKLYKDIFYILINLTLVIACFYVKALELNSIINLLICFIYLMYIFVQKNLNIVKNQLILSLFINFFYGVLWRKTMIQVPFELKYILDVICFILFIKVLCDRKRYMKSLRDSVIVVYIIFILIFTSISLMKNIDIINFIMSLRIYVRYIPIYIVIYNDFREYNKEEIILLILMNASALPLEILRFHQDDVAGLFGISSVQIFYLFLTILFFIDLSLYIYRIYSFKKFLCFTAMIFLLFGQAEIKIAFIIVPVCIVFVLIINMKSFVDIIKIFLPLILIISISLNQLFKVSPYFSEFFKPDKIEENFKNYLLESSNPIFELGRLENVIYTHENILIEPMSRFIGNGIGSSMPDDNWYYNMENVYKGRQVHTPYLTKMYEEMGVYFGYHLSSINIMYLEIGIFGIILHVLAILICFFRAIYVIKRSDNANDKAIANSLIALSITWILLLFYYSYILDFNAGYLLTWIMALTSKNYKILKNNGV